MTQVKASLKRQGQFWNGIMNFFRSREVYAANRGDESGNRIPDSGAPKPSYDDLKNVKTHEVIQAQNMLLPQLASNTLNSIQTNFICNLSLDTSLAECPAEICGRVIDTYPHYDPDFRNPMETVFLQVPRKGQRATIVEVPTKIIRSYPLPSSQFVKIPIWATSLDLSDLEGYYEIFGSKGLQLEIHIEPEDLRLLYSNTISNPMSMPWLFIITSDWLSSLLPDTYEMLVDKLDLLLVKRNARIVNYHPRGGLILNDVTDYLQGEGTNYFVDSHSPLNLLKIIELELDRYLSRPM